MRLPGPRGLPLIGSAHRLLPVSRAHLTIEEWGRRYGPIFRVNLGSRPVIGIDDAEAINAILRDRPEGFRRWSDQQEIIEEMHQAFDAGADAPRNVFTAEGEEWKRQRRLVIDDLTSFTVDITSALAFGHDPNTLERGDVELQRHIHRVMRMTARRLGTPFPYWRQVKLPADRALDRLAGEDTTSHTIGWAGVRPERQVGSRGLRLLDGATRPAGAASGAPVIHRCNAPAVRPISNVPRTSSPGERQP